MSIIQKVALLSVVGLITLGTVGCADHDVGREVDPDTRLKGDPGLQSRDLREMTGRMAPDLLTIPEISRNPNRIVVVMKSIDNQTVSYAGQSMDIFVAKLKTLLNSSQTRDRIAFVENQKDIQRLQGEELGGTGPGFGDEGRTEPGPSSRLLPQFALWGTFYEQRGAKSSYFLCTFRLTDINSGVQVWEGSYDVKTLN